MSATINTREQEERILENPKKNPLATQSIGKLILQYALPAMISSLVGSIYNIVDQIFVGNSVGELGNAATNVAFPLVMIVTTIAMTLGVGAASSFSLHLGRKEPGKAKAVVGTSLALMIGSGILISIISAILLRPILTAFGGRDQTLAYAMQYTSLLLIGFPFAILGTGATQLIRADGSPKYAMFAMLSGAILNCILDPIFIFTLNLGMTGAALATIIGQAVSGILIIGYFFRFRTFKITIRDLIPRFVSIRQILSLGVAAGANQLAVTIVQIVLNNVLGHYGEQSIYGRDIPLACVGVIMKVSSLFNSVIFGISQSTQPIIGFNYGAHNFARVKKTFLTAAKIIVAISCVAFLCFQIFPRQITSIFGSGDELYYQFATAYFRIFLMLVPVVGLQILAANFFPSIGKGGLGTLVSLSRQVICLLPLILILPMIFGIDGVLYAGPIADGISTALSVGLVWYQMRQMSNKDLIQ